jgi:rhodanese-related sulfurtransferase/rubrerythrin
MQGNDIHTIWPEELQDYFRDHAESDYLLIDVRQPEEYEAEHIPGAQLMVLGTLDSKIQHLPRDTDLIFYCHSGMRSRVAGDLCAERGFDPQRIYSLTGGISAWEDPVLPDYPQLHILQDLPTSADIMETAMNLEKGAARFYAYLVDKLKENPIVEALEKIAAMEHAHAKLIYNTLTTTEKDEAAFEATYGSLSGDIMEGGQSLDAACRKLENLPGSFLTNALEMALGIEYAAYDLYRTFADTSDDAAVQKAFFTLCQAEKKHIEQIAKLFENAYQ